ncbi:MFS transporter [Streptomyces sp. XM4193]|uniref:MFS transporter n=1 Tax=Streptomyces sp. XM4193 TaxID=2929782 RepID=UPI001FFAF5A9|nr:MFS transporter [Streptomyces sp. XM4193]MCK1794829.1 MFS transporter [Streptomyces sp. XM4193]
MTTASSPVSPGRQVEPERQRPPRGLTLPFYCYAVFSNSLFQRGVFVLYLFHLGFSAGQVALLQALLYLVSAVAEVPTGFLADRMGRRASIVTGQLMTSLCLIAEVTFSGYPTFVGIFFLYGVGMAFVSGTDTALLYDTLRRRGLEDHYVRIKARYVTAGSVAMALAIALGGSLQEVSWQLVYLPAAGCLLVSLVFLTAGVEEIRGKDVADLDAAAEDDENKPSDGPQSGKREVLRSLTPRLASLVLVSGLMHATMTPYFIFVQEGLDSQGLPTFLISVVVSVAFLIGGFAPLLADRAEQRLGMRVLVPATLVVLMLSLALSGAGVAWLTVVVFLVAVGAPDLTAVVVDDMFNRSVPSRFRSSLLSIITFVESLLIACGYFLLGRLIEALGPDTGFLFYAAVPAVALVLSVPSLLNGRWVKVLQGTHPNS